MKEISSHITINPEIRFGKPCIKGTRIAVMDILQWLASGMTQEEILHDYPLLTREHILAARAFAANRESIIKILLLKMKLLVDANVSWRLAAKLKSHFEECLHVGYIGLNIPQKTPRYGVTL